MEHGEGEEFGAMEHSAVSVNDATVVSVLQLASTLRRRPKAPSPRRRRRGTLHSMHSLDAALAAGRSLTESIHSDSLTLSAASFSSDEDGAINSPEEADPPGSPPAPEPSSHSHPDSGSDSDGNSNGGDRSADSSAATGASTAEQPAASQLVELPVLPDLFSLLHLSLQARLGSDGSLLRVRLVQGEDSALLASSLAADDLHLAIEQRVHEEAVRAMRERLSSGGRLLVTALERVIGRRFGARLRRAAEEEDSFAAVEAVLLDMLPRVRQLVKVWRRAHPTRPIITSSPHGSGDDGDDEPRQRQRRGRRRRTKRQMLAKSESIVRELASYGPLSAAQLHGEVGEVAEQRATRLMLAARGTKGGWREFASHTAPGCQGIPEQMARMSLVLAALEAHREEYVAGNPWFMGPFHYGPKTSTF